MRRTLVTGAASGIGRETALMAARRGDRVVGFDRQADALAELRTEAGHQGLDIQTEVVDVSDRASIERAVDRACDAAGPLDGLACSAGISEVRPFLEISASQWSDLIAVNLTGTWSVAQCVARRMVEQGTAGSIVTVSSAQGFRGRVGGAHYAASKAGVIALTKSMALELAPHHIRVNSVAPGAVETPLLRRVVTALPGGEERSRGRIPLGRLGQPDDVAEAICLLLSDDTSWVTGQTVHVNGGSLLI